MNTSLARQHSDKTLNKDEAESSPNSPTKKVPAAHAAPEVIAGPPLDYSFLEIASVEELREVMPRSGYRKEPQETMEDEQGQQVPNPLHAEWVAPPRAFETKAIKLGNNMLTALPPAFNVVIREVIEKPRLLSWIDLSFNQLEEVPQILALYSDLSVVYLHANRIRKVSQAKVLTDLQNLRSLTLHGNPCEDVKNYRLMVTGMFPKIKTLDFTTITTIDREKAHVFYTRFLKQKENRASGGF